MGQLILIAGDDEYSVRNRARASIIQAAGQNPEDNPCLEIIAGDRDDRKPPAALSELLNAIDTPAFLGADKILWLKHFPFDEANKSKSGKKLLEMLIQQIKEGLPDDLTMIIDGSGLDRRSALYKACQKHAEIIWLSKPDPNSREFAGQIRDRINAYCRNHGVRLEANACDYLTETAGTDPGRLQHELDKLFSFIHPRELITIEDCRNVCSHTPEAAAWAFADAVGERKLETALDTLNTLINNRNYEIAILHGVTKRFREMLDAKIAAPILNIPRRAQYGSFKSCVQNPPPQLRDELAGNLMLTGHPYRAWKIFDQSENFSDDEIRSALKILLQANQKLVSSSGELQKRMPLEDIAIRFCKAQR